MTKNKIIAFGYVGNMRVYLNVSREEAERRFKVEFPQDQDWLKKCREFEFDDEFEVYDIWEKGN